MTPVVDIIGAVVTEMKPAIDSLTYSISTTYITFSTTDRGILRRLFVNEKIKVTGNDNVIYYGKIDTITEWTSFRAVFTSLPASVTSITRATLVINYHYGHPIEIINLFKQASHAESYKYDQFPAICLMQDFPEKFTDSGFEREVELNVVIVTDTKREYEASERYSLIFTPLLYKIYDKFIDELAASTYIAGSSFEHTKYDRLYWGKTGLYGNQGNIFNDFIDAIELENLKLRILKTC